MTMETDSNESAMPGFQFENSNLNKRCNDVFASLDALEKKHKAFEVSRAREDADTDRHLLTQTPSEEETETVFKRPTVNTGRDYQNRKKGGHHGNRDQPFRKPMPPSNYQRGRGQFRGRFGRGRAVPDYKLHPERWTEYSLEDVDTSDNTNKQAALAFLDERRRMKEGQAKQESINVDSTACSSGTITFKKPNKMKTKSSDSSQTSKTRKDKADSAQMFDEYEKMDDSDDDDMSGSTSHNFDRSNSNNTVSNTDRSKSYKRKLDISELDELESKSESSESDQPTSFKSRKFSKKNIRSRQRMEEGDDD